MADAPCAMRFARQATIGGVGKPSLYVWHSERGMVHKGSPLYQAAAIITIYSLPAYLLTSLAYHVETVHACALQAATHFGWSGPHARTAPACCENTPANISCLCASPLFSSSVCAVGVNLCDTTCWPGHCWIGHLVSTEPHRPS